MALQIRRGTNTERLTITPNQGELLWTTDTKTLYVGDGTTPGGRVVSGDGGGGGATALSELTDVIIDQAAVGEVLTWDGTTWVNAAPDGGGGGISYAVSAITTTGGAFIRLSGSDATTDDIKLSEGANITITRTDANTIEIAAAGGGGGGVSNLNELGDVVITAPDNAALLKYNNVDGKWEDGQANITELADVQIGTPGAGSVLKYNYAIGHWEDGHTDLGDLGDVLVMPIPDNGMVLRYDHTLDTWTNGYTNVTELGDFELVGALLDGQVLKYDLAAGKWKNTDDAGALTLSQLSDVDTGAILTGDALVWTGTAWTSEPMPTALDQLSDIAITNLQPGHTLTYDSGTSTWVNGNGVAIVSTDTSPELGGDLSLAGFNINGTGSINIVGNVDAIEFTGHFNGNVLGDLNGNVTGNITGIVSGTAGSNIVGTLTGDSAGAHTGTSRGNILSAFNGVVLLDSSTSVPTLTGVTVYGTVSGLVRAFPPVTNRTVNPMYAQAWPTVESGIRLDAFINNYIDHNFADGTVGAMTRPATGTILGGLRHRVWNGTNYQVAAAVLTRYDSIATDTSSAGLPGSTIILRTGTAGGVANYATLDSAGTFAAATLQTNGYATGSYPATPVEGMMIFDTTTKHFFGYTGSVGGWKQLDN